MFLIYAFAGLARHELWHGERTIVRLGAGEVRVRIQGHQPCSVLAVDYIGHQEGGALTSECMSDIFVA